MRFFQGKTQMEVAEEIGISQAQVSRLEKAAIKEMNKNIQSWSHYFKVRIHKALAFYGRCFYLMIFNSSFVKY